VDHRARFTGRENDGTGLSFYRARYYDARLQRFVGEDPIAFDAGDPNLYSYVRSAPIQLRDPSGEVAIGVVIIGIGAGYGAVTEGIHAYATGGNVGTAIWQGAVAGAIGAGAGIAGAWTGGPMAAGASSSAAYSVAIGYFNGNVSLGQWEPMPRSVQRWDHSLAPSHRKCLDVFRSCSAVDRLLIYQSPRHNSCFENQVWVEFSTTSVPFWAKCSGEVAAIPRNSFSGPARIFAVRIGMDPSRGAINELPNHVLCWVDGATETHPTSVVTLAWRLQFQSGYSDTCRNSFRS
jgi:RHS repeat-associated protein